jgi:tetratricopeptide (TPR) repeat protein
MLLKACDFSCKIVTLLNVLAILFLIFSVCPWGFVQAQSGEGINDREAQRHLDLGLEYELADELDLALEEYYVAAQAESDDLALKARRGINRVLSKRNSFWNQVRRELEKFLVWLTSSLGKLILLITLFLLVGQIILLAIDAQQSWKVIPFFDLTQNDLGEAVSESIIAHIHEIRLLHIHVSEGMLNVSEEVDLPSFGASSHKESMLASLKSMDSLDVSGIGLPVGSVLSSIVQWLDMGGNHISGTIQKQGQDLHLSAQLHKGRRSGVDKMWAVRGCIDENGTGATLFNLERELANCIMFDVQEEWAASTPQSLMFFTEGLKHFQSFQVHPTVQEENLQKAVELFKNSLSIDPSYVAAMYNLALVYQNLGLHQEALETLKRLRLQPDHGLDLEIAYNLGIAYYHSLLGDWTYDYAEREFARVVEALAEKDNVGTDRELLALAHCGLTSVCAQKIHYENSDLENLFRLATQHYRKSLAIVNQNPQIVAVAHTAIGMALLNMKQVKKAVAKFEEAVRMKPDYWRAYIHWGRAEMTAGKPERAVICLKQALALNPEYEFAQYQLGIALKKLGEYERAAEAFSRAPSIAKAHDERGSILAEHRQEYQAALVEFEKALEIKEDLSNALVNIAWYILEAGYRDDEHLDKALECARKAVELDEDTGNAWHRHSVLGRVYLTRGDFEMARKELEESIRLNEKMPQSYFFLAKTHLELGDLKAARKALAEFLNRPSKSPWYGGTHETAVTLIQEISEQLERINDIQ